MAMGALALLAFAALLVRRRHLQGRTTAILPSA
jgi:hypothetical protein